MRGMTNEEIDKLEAGRELDALIAEKVMGWTPHCQNPAHYVEVANSTSEMSVIQEVVAYWRPSTDIAAAWQVVEKLRAAGWFYSLSDAVEIPEYIVMFYQPDSPDAQAMDESAPLAICRAALKATTTA